MLEKEQFIPHLLREFPEFRRSLQRQLMESGHAAGPSFDLSLFARFVIEDLYEQAKHEELGAAFERIEQFLTNCTPDGREIVALGFLESLRTLASWKPYGSEVFIQFLRPESRRVWEKLDAAWDLSLDDCGVLEGEVLTWRVIRQTLRRADGFPR